VEPEGFQASLQITGLDSRDVLNGTKSHPIALDIGIYD